MSYRILQIDPSLKPFEKDIELRMANYKRVKKELLGKDKSLEDFANAHQYFGFHRTETGWVYREWAPAAEAMFLTGDFNGWDPYACPLKKLSGGVFEGYLLSKIFDLWTYPLVKQWHTPEKLWLVFLVVTVPTFICTLLLGKLVSMAADAISNQIPWYKKKTKV